MRLIVLSSQSDRSSEVRQIAGKERKGMVVVAETNTGSLTVMPNSSYLKGSVYEFAKRGKQKTG